MSKRAIRWILITGLIAGLVLGNYIQASAGGAHRRTPPGVWLISRGEVVQRAKPYTYCWSYGTAEGGAVGMCADGWARYPEPARVEAGSRVRLRIRYPIKPSDWFLEAHRVVMEQGDRHEPVGPAEEIAFRLRPHRVDGIVKAWDVVFRPEEPLRHYYLNTGGQLQQGDAFYALHIQT